MTQQDAHSASVEGFDRFPLDRELLAAVEALGFTEPTPIQVQAIPVAMSGRDVIGRARTGSGKTLAFGLPLLHLVRGGGRSPRALVMTPTRELALQVTAALQAVTSELPIRLLTIYGGTPYPPQLKALAKGVTAVVGTPGRLCDLLDRGVLDLSEVELLVLDEADEMLRMGFVEDVERIMEATRPGRQVMLFSASMPAPMRRIANKHLRNPVEVQVEEQALTVHHIDQRWMRVPNKHKLETLHRILNTEEEGTALVFTGTRVGCVDVADGLSQRGVRVDMLHGGLHQTARERVLQRVRSGGARVLVATDVAARGIDVQHISLVVNYDLPDSHERYVHRIGRTARAGREGVAITLVTPKQKRRLHEMARALTAEITQAEIPTDGAITKERRQRLRSKVRAAGRADLSHAQTLVAELMAADGRAAEQVAAAAIAVLASTLGVSLDTSADGRLPSWVRPVERQPSHPHPAEDINEVELFLAVGKRRKVRPQSVVAALTRDAGVPAGLIGRIRIEDHRTFVGMPRAVAEKLVRERDVLTIQGRDVPFELAAR